MRHFTVSHEWIELKGKIGTVGVTDFAQKELGEVVYVQLPKAGQILRVGEEAAILESTKAAADTYAPVSGKVVAVNEAVVKQPTLINQSPEEGGWLFQIEVKDKTEFDHLLSKQAYLELVSS